MLRMIATVALLICCLCLSAGCGSSRRGEPIEGPLQPASQEVALGREAFMRHCHQCHPGGEAGLGPSLNNKPAPGFLIRFQVRHGLGAMPAFTPEHLGDAELEAIIAYLLTLRHH